ncbi:uncharacterized protein CTRU02_200547 [Colletotrichum truncatum]|uniref:Uncharacterized protein n=1 Tax=Colletotrichum truncatum TaxID=5467 RepID=A0ACC3ZEX3_COLTU|nr:uncharacterized protein CTRU02_00310 [Colletotrichum truncatum]KAF6801561.1 hypothetical protein CTRU02_00310 [Colletotrichum truncatum]
MGLPMWDTDIAVLSGRDSRPQAFAAAAPCPVSATLEKEARFCTETVSIKRLQQEQPSPSPSIHSLLTPLPAGPAPKPKRGLAPSTFSRIQHCGASPCQPFLLRWTGRYLWLHLWHAATPCHRRGSPPSKLVTRHTLFTEANDTPRNCAS